MNAHVFEPSGETKHHKKIVTDTIFFDFDFFNEEAYLTYVCIYHKALYWFYFDCDIILALDPNASQYLCNENEISCSR